MTIKQDAGIPATTIFIATMKTIHSTISAIRNPIWAIVPGIGKVQAAASAGAGTKNRSSIDAIRPGPATNMGGLALMAEATSMQSGPESKRPAWTCHGEAKTADMVRRISAAAARP